MEMRVKVGVVAALLAMLVSSGVSAADRIDRVLAVVNSRTITESDVRAALAFGLAGSPGAGADPIRTALDQLIRRELIVDELTRTAPAEVDSARVAARLDAIRARFPSAAAYEARLAETAMNDTRLRDIIEADIRVEDYVRQRFGAVAEPSDAEVAAYYGDHASEFTAAGRPLSFEEARPAVKQRMIEERRRQLVDDWVGRLRRRAEISDLYYAGATK